MSSIAIRYCNNGAVFTDWPRHLIVASAVIAYPIAASPVRDPTPARTHSAALLPPDFGHSFIPTPMPSGPSAVPGYSNAVICYPRIDA